MIDPAHTLVITVLIDNTPAADGRLAAEHGLSLLLEFNPETPEYRSILFDCGAGPAFADNAALLDKDLSRVDYLTLSHGHYDHGGGLETFFELNSTARILHGPAALVPEYWRPLPGKNKYLGLLQEPIVQHRERFQLVKESLTLWPGCRLLTALPRRHPLPPGNKGLCRTSSNGKLEPDPFNHELVLLLDYPRPVLFTGCAHSGIINLTEAALELTDGPLELVIGGFHLPDDTTPADYTAATARQLAALPVNRFVTGHCTGPQSHSILEKVLGEKLLRFHSGWQLTIH